MCDKFICGSLFQVLISDASMERGTNKRGKAENGKVSSSKSNPTNAPSESHVEMDSRLLTALLTVSNNSFLSLLYYLNIK